MLTSLVQFEDAGLHPVMLRNIGLCGYKIPTPIQAYVLPAVFKDQDVIGVAQTGSGKTAAYLIPVLSKLMGKARKLAAPRPNPATAATRDQWVRAEPLVLVVVPTRELATQIFDEARRLAYRSMLRPSVLYGGAPTSEQRGDLGKGCDILVATTGRLKDMLKRNNVLSLRRVKYTIVDEADEMVDDGWADDMAAIMGGDSNEDDDHVYMMFSATFPKEARKVAKKYMANDHVRIRVGRIGSTHLNVTQKVCWSPLPTPLLRLTCFSRSFTSMITRNGSAFSTFYSPCLPLVRWFLSIARRLQISSTTSCTTASYPVLPSTVIELNVNVKTHCMLYSMQHLQYAN